jgi:hypothetical protein
MKWMRGSHSPALPSQATLAWGRRLPGLRVELLGVGRLPRWDQRLRVCESAPLGLPELPTPRPASPESPAQFPGSGASPPEGGAEPGLGVLNRPGGCAGDSAAKAHLVGRWGERVRTEHGIESLAD